MTLLLSGDLSTTSTFLDSQSTSLCASWSCSNVKLYKVYLATGILPVVFTLNNWLNSTEIESTES